MQISWLDSVNSVNKVGYIWTKEASIISLKQCLWFGKHTLVCVVLFGVWFLNVFGIMFGCVWCLVFGQCFVVFGVWLRCCVVFGVRAW